jgi:hypothetical protein
MAERVDIFHGGEVMDHVVYLDFKANELGRLTEKSKTMIIRGATGKKLPYGRVSVGDVLYFVENNGDGLVRAKATVESVFNSEKMSDEESNKLVQDSQGRLNLTDKQYERWAGKRYIVLIGVKDFERIEPFKIDRSGYGNMDDWLPVEKIEGVQTAG